MKAAFIFLIAIISWQNSYSQNIVPSDCDGPDSVKALYKNDAGKLSVRWIFGNNHASKNSVRIPDSLSNIFMNALLAVHNAKTLAARDTVISKFGIHAFCSLSLKQVIVSADSNASWMKSLRYNRIPTGNKYLDSIIYDLNLTLKSYSDSRPFKEHRVVFKSETAYNIYALSDEIEQLDSVEYASPNSCIGDGNDVSASIHNNFVELVYSYGWEDCPAGCGKRRYWKFRIYNDCGVEFVESYGDKLLYTGLSEISSQNISVYPNPFNNIIIVNGINTPFKYSIHNILGKIVLDGKSNNQSISGLEGLEGGIYILYLQTDGEIQSIKLLKN